MPYSSKWKHLGADTPPATRVVKFLRLRVLLPWRIDITSCYAVASCDVMWCHDVMPWRYVTSQCHSKGQSNVTCHTKQEKVVKLTENHVFQPDDLELWPMTLPIKLIRDMAKMHLCTKFEVRTSNSSVVRVLTNRHTDRRDRFYYLDRWRGR